MEYLSQGVMCKQFWLVENIIECECFAFVKIVGIFEDTLGLFYQLCTRVGTIRFDASVLIIKNINISMATAIA